MFDDTQSPFTDPKALNPFRDDAVERFTAKTPPVSQKVDHYNPFVEDHETQVRDTQQSTGNPNPSPLPSVSTGVLQRQQDILEHTAARLDGNQTIAQRIDNFPPLPSFCPCKPCFYQDFDVDIPASYRRLVKIGYYYWILYSFVLLVNVAGAFAYLIVASQHGNPGYSGTTFGVSILHLVVASPCSFVCWYRPLYKAFRSDNSLNFFWFFLVSFCKLILLVIACMGGLFENGFIGWFVAIRVASYSVVGYFLLAIAFVFTCLAIAQFVLLITGGIRLRMDSKYLCRLLTSLSKYGFIRLNEFHPTGRNFVSLYEVIRSYRVSGASFQQAQQQAQQQFYAVVQQSAATTNEDRY